MDKLRELYIQHTGKVPEKTEVLAGAGSNRRYVRFHNDAGTVIGVIGTSKEENRAFITIARHLHSKGLAVPEVLACSNDEMRYLQEDLGSVALFDAIAEGRAHAGAYNIKEVEQLKATLRQLPRLQILGAEGMPWEVCYPQPAFDKENVFFDLNYFKYCFLKATGVDFHESRLEDDFRHLANDLVADTENEDTCGTYTTMERAFMYRDFQARNVMLKDGEPSFIDFQGGRCGPCYYDLASFLWQASAKYSNALRNELIELYYNELKALTTVPCMEEFLKRLNLFVFFRTLQVLGAYGFRGYFERKEHFINSIPAAINNLRTLLEKGAALAYPHLNDVLLHMVALPRFEEKTFTNEGPLVVRVMSFSFKKGLPEDPSGNGGGYIFDCRSTHNPGRYEPYKKLTGLDEPVIRFLEEDGEITTFLQSVYDLADAHVERYLRRGFTSLMFCFGCTGGQHRSVYSAQHLAERLHRKYGIRVELTHREQGIHQIMDNTKQEKP